jgi:hypothetical protein
MNKARLFLTVIVLLGSVTLLCGHDDRSRPAPPKNAKKADSKLDELMKAKLNHSQKVLEGVALGDFKEIARNAEELISISKQAEWQVIHTPQYELRSNEFRRTAEELVKNAEAKNLDAAALSYVELTMTCVKCHKYVREVIQVRRDGRPTRVARRGLDACLSPE